MSATAITIEKLVQGGYGLAHREGKVLFVRGAIPGETVSVTVQADRKGYQEATVNEVMSASPDRVEAPCPVYQVCGGCQLQHLRYEAQLLRKAEMLQETLARIGKIELPELPSVVPSPAPYGYRNSLRFVVFRKGKGFAVGFHREGSRHPVEAAGCLLAPPATRDLLARVHERLAALRVLPLRLDSLEVRSSTSEPAALLLFRTGQATRRQAEQLAGLFEDVPGVVGRVVLAPAGVRWVFGRDWIVERLRGLIFRISDQSFAQANWRLNETLSETLTDWVAPGPGLRVLELYGGIGSLGLPLARAGALVTEVETNRTALADARYAARANHIGRCRFRLLLAEAALAVTQPGDYDVVLVDPPRTGLSPDVLRHLVRLGAARLFYLSCDPPTLARDLRALCEGGYHVMRLQAFDMFPQTAHLETLVEFAR